MTTIWALFSVDNNYDQPDHNLVAWWPERPTMVTLESFIHDRPEERGPKAASLLVGGTVRQDTFGTGTLLRLREIGPGESTEAWT